MGRDSIIVLPKSCLRGMYAPLAFTPNGDNLNDNFKPLFFGNVLKYEFRILNRYGQTVFSSTVVGKGWDGKLGGKNQNPGSFAWICIYQIEGQMVNTETGSMILVR